MCYERQRVVVVVVVVVVVCVRAATVINIFLSSSGRSAASVIQKEGRGEGGTAGEDA
jgi:hypothetical protein